MLFIHLIKTDRIDDLFEIVMCICICGVDHKKQALKNTSHTISCLQRTYLDCATWRRAAER